MSLSYQVSPEKHLVVAVASGQVSRADFDQMRSSILADERIGPGMALLFETDGAEPLLTFTDLNEIACRLEQVFDKGIGRIAIVASSKFLYSLARTFGVFAAKERVSVKPFERIEDAEDWLSAA
ncbi:MAG: STAS/SEC14 domain-containing protein [Gemmatimonadota bacterium]|nr:STAS/SEC14 domain-containing protein [Gemmatimonadota bacterium]